jgi:hypothetical protein
VYDTASGHRSSLHATAVYRCWVAALLIAATALLRACGHPGAEPYYFKDGNTCRLLLRAPVQGSTT